jgi:acyl carrier protein
VTQKFQERVDSIIRVIVDRVNPDLDPSELSAGTRLVNEGLALDSMAVLELVTGLEDELGEMIDESKLKIEMFEDIGSFARSLDELVE